VQNDLQLANKAIAAAASAMGR
jgi:hypothetical protein